MLIVSIILRNLTHSPLDRKIEKYIKEICFQKENGRSSSFSHCREKFGNLDRKFDEEARFSSFLDPFPWVKIRRKGRFRNPTAGQFARRRSQEKVNVARFCSTFLLLFPWIRYIERLGYSSSALPIRHGLAPMSLLRARTHVLLLLHMWNTFVHTGDYI